MSSTQAPPPQSSVGRKWRFAWCEYLEVSRQLLVNGIPVKLETKPLDLLQHLLEEPAKVHTKTELFAAVWADTTISDQSLATAISKLRRAFGGERDDIILNVSGTGYRMAVTPTVCEDQASEPPAFHLQPGDSIPSRANWRALRPLGFVSPGHTPMVWLAEHIKTHEARVFKYAVNGIALRALQQEVTLFRFLKKSLPGDPRFVNILDWDLDNSPYFLETEYSGPNLLYWANPDWAKSGFAHADGESDPSEPGPFAAMTLAQRTSLVAELAEAVADAHALGILHNDLKPSNVLVMPPHSSESDRDMPQTQWHIKVADFGIAILSRPERIRELEITYHDLGNAADNPNQANPAQTRSNLSGSAMYRAPEQLTGAAPSIPGDVYALGVILYQVVCGDLLATLSPGWESRVTDPLLRQDIAEAANLDPKLRIQTAAELAQRLRTLDQRRAQGAQQQQLLAAAQLAQKALADARLRRPWIIFALIALSLGLTVSFVYYRRAVHARDVAEKQSSTNASMFQFLAEDLLGQSNPFGKTALAAQPPGQTLAQAIDSALPKIDERFKKDPATAAQLHLTIALALTDRTLFEQADAEYQAASKRFRETTPDESQQAIVTELRRAASIVAGNAPGSLIRADQIVAEQKRLIAQIPKPSVELQGWLAATEAATVGSGSHPEQALLGLSRIIQLAEADPSFNPNLLLTLRHRFCYLYIRLGDGPKAEAASRAYLAAVNKTEGPASPKRIWGQMTLFESLCIQGKNKEAIQQINQIYPDFIRLLGPTSMYVIQALSTRAVAEGELKDYDAAIRDDLAAHDVAMANPSAFFFQVGGFVDAGTSECRIHRFSSGIIHIRQAYSQVKSETGTNPGLAGGTAFALAECLLAQNEDPASPHNPAALIETKALLNLIDARSVAHLSGNAGFEGNVDVAQARLAFDQKQFKQAADFAAKAHPFFDGPGADIYEKESLGRIETALSRRNRLAR